MPSFPRAPFTAGEDGPCEEPDAPEPYACPSIAGSPNDGTHPPPPKTLLAPGDPRNDWVALAYAGVDGAPGEPMILAPDGALDATLP